MITADGKISIKQLKRIMVLEVFGTGLIALPRVAAGFAGSDGWLLALGAACFALIYLMILNSLAGMFPQKTFPVYSREIAGAPAGFALSALLVFKLIFTAGIELRIIGEILIQTMLHNTPRAATCAVMAAVSAHIAYKGLETRARIAEALFVFVVVPALIIFLAAGINADYSNLLPAFKTPAQSLLLGSYCVSFAFRGLELTLLLYPFVNEPRRIKHGQTRAVLLTGAAMLFVTAITLIKFGENDVKAQLWPVIQMADTFKLAGRIFERQDALLLSFWLISAFVYLSGGVFFSSHICGEMLGGGRFVLPCAALVYAVSFIPRDTHDAYGLIAAVDLTLGAAFLFIIPVLLITAAKMRRIGGERG